MYIDKGDAELPSRNPEQKGDLPIGQSAKRECPQLTCELVGVAMSDSNFTNV